MADTVAVPLRWADTDAYGHIHHAVYLSLIEQARMQWLDRLLSPDGRTWDHALVRVAIDYRRELLLEHETAVCGFSVTRVGGSSIALAETISTPDGTVVAELDAVVVAWEPAAHQTRRLTDTEREALATAAAPAHD